MFVQTRGDRQRSCVECQGSGRLVMFMRALTTEGVELKRSLRVTVMKVREAGRKD